jgi:hypothetical protein
LQGVGRVRTNPNEVAPLAPGTEVLVSYEYGAPLIMGVINVPASDHADTTAFNVTDVEGFGGSGGINQTTRTGVGNYRGAREPRDVMPGDWAQVGTEGNTIATLNGGVNVIRSSTLAQIRTHLINDLVEIFSRNYRHITDMGEFSVFNDDGRINMRFRGATDQRSEAGPDEENWTIRFDMGAEGDILNFELTTPQGNTLFRFHVDAEGRCEIYGVNGVDIGSGARAGGSHTEEHTGNSQRTVEGNRVTTTMGDETRNIEGNNTTEVSSDYVINAGNDHRTQTLRDYAVGCGRNMNVAVQDTLTYDIEEGGWTIDIGSITSTNAGYTLKTFGGPIKMESQLGGDIELSSLLGHIKTQSQDIKVVTALPDSVILGGEALVSHVVKWEELVAYLTALHTALDLHIHTEPGTSVAAGVLPVTGVSGPPAVPIGAPLAGTFVNFRSLKVGVDS